MDWCSRLQGATSRSTPEAEIVAGADCLARSAIPIQIVLEDLHSRSIRLQCFTDNETGMHDLDIGYSKQMRHLRKHHHVSLGLIRDTMEREEDEVRSLESGLNPSDILTKFLNGVLRQRHMIHMNMDSLP